MSTADRAIALHLQYPKEYIAFSRGYDPSINHYGVDMAWNADKGGKYPPVYAPGDGKVVTSAWHNSYGYYVQIEHASGIRTLMAHMKEMPCVKVGDKVKRGQRVGTQGSTGNSTGPHVHFELRLDGMKVNPVPYVFAYPEQEVNSSTQRDFGIKHYSPVKYVGTPVPRDSSVDQLKVITDTLRAREKASLSATVFGYVTPGIYNVEDIRDAEGYRWYDVGDFWCANNKAETWCNFLPKTEPHFDLLMKKLNTQQKDSMVAWCKAEGVEYSVTEV